MEKQLTGPTSLTGTTSRFLKYPIVFLFPLAHAESRVKSPSNSQTGKLSIIYWHGTGCDFYASLFSRNWREIVEHRRFREIGPRWHHEVDASGRIMQHGLERGVCSFYNLKNRDLAPVSISIVPRCREPRNSRIRRSFHVRATFYSDDIRGSARYVRSFPPSVRADCSVTLSRNLRVLLFPPFTLFYKRASRASFRSAISVGI